MKTLFLQPRDGSPAPRWSVALGWFFASLLVAALFTFSFHQLLYRWDWSGVYRYRAKLWQGWCATVLISLAALVTSTLLGVTLALARRSRLLVLRALARIYVEGIRGTPLLVQLLIFFYVVASALRIDNRYLVGVLALSIFSSAYVSEIFRAGLESVGKSQLDSARAVGFTPAQTYRYVILPQALRHVLPPLAGQFASLIKDSSLLSVIAIRELTQSAREITSDTFATFECYGVLALGYLVLTLPISLWSRALEERSRYET